MGSRGRQSGASLSVTPVLPVQRPEPPSELTEEQAKEWRATVARMPADWFGPEVRPLLTQYVRHIANARAIVQLIDVFTPAQLADDNGLRRFARLTRLAERETRAMSSLATRMRLTPQSRYTPHRAATTARASTQRKPWEFEG